MLILGGTGAVGKLAVQVAARHGAGRIVVVGRDADALKRTLELGAHAAIPLRPDESDVALAHHIRETVPAVDVILDALYGVPLQAALQATASRARVVNVGNAAGTTAILPAGVVRSRQLTISGFAGFYTSVAEKRTALGWCWEALRRGELDVDIRTRTLEELPQAWAEQASSPHAKLVILPAGGS